IFDALADGRLHLTAVGLMAPYLTPENAAELLGAAAHRTKAGIEELIAGRFPQSEALGVVTALPVSLGPAEEQLAPGRVGMGGPGATAAPSAQLAPERVAPLSKMTAAAV